MSVPAKLKHELKAIGVAALYFGSWIGMLLVLKSLVLAEYQIPFHGWSVILVGALILSKVVLILEHVSLGAWVRKQPAWVEVLLRTALYSVGLVIVLILEKGFEGRHKHGGFGPAVKVLFGGTDIHHVWANSICLGGAFLTYNMLSVIRRHLGHAGLRRLFLLPLPEASKATPPTGTHPPPGPRS